MTLNEFLQVADENKMVIVCDSERNKLAEYDGKNSIPLSLGGSRVRRISPGVLYEEDECVGICPVAYTEIVLE